MQKNKVIGCLNDLKRSRDIQGAWNAGRKAMRTRVVVAAFGTVAVIPFFQSPCLSREFPVRRVDDDTASGGIKRVAGVFLQTVVRASAVGYIKSLEVRLAVRLAAHVRRGFRRIRRRSGNHRRHLW